MARDLSQFIRDNLTYFQSFSKVILYYDNGQHELNRILNTVFATQLVDYDVRKVIPNEYRFVSSCRFDLYFGIVTRENGTSRFIKFGEENFSFKERFEERFLERN